MNNELHKQAVREAVKDKFGRKQYIESTVHPRHPDSEVREYTRALNAYFRIFNKTLKEHLPKIIELYKTEQRADSAEYRADDFSDFKRGMNDEFLKILKKLEKRMSAYGLEKLVNNIASMTKTNSVKEWKRVVKKTLGVDLLDDYYSGEFYGDTLKKWADENVSQIKTLPTESLEKMKEIILEGYENGVALKSIQKNIQNEYDVAKGRAILLARDQISTLNSLITQAQHRDAGINKYKWDTSGDSRVRECHRSLDGKIFSWDDPPPMWYRTKKGIVFTGRRCHPGEDYECRCVPLPVFDIETLDIPIQVTPTKVTIK